MKSVTQSQSDSRGVTIDVLRRFHYGEPAAASATSLPQAGTLPALLHPYRDAEAIRYDYPLYLAPVADDEDEEIATPLGSHLSAALAAFALGEDSARVLRDNLAWLERHLRQALEGPDPVDAPELIARAATALQDHLELRDDAHDKLQADLDNLQASFAAGSLLLGYGPDTPLHLFVHAVRHRNARLHAQLEEDIARATRRLGALLEVEDAKAGTRNSDGAKAAARHLDTDKLTSLLETRVRGSVAMPPERRARIGKALDVLRAWNHEPVLVRFVGKIANPWFAAQPDVDVIGSDTPCNDADEVFERDATRFAELFAALRIAALEIDNKYSAAVHDSWFDEFDWQAFSDEELQHVTRVVALVSADYLAGDGLPSLSRLLGSRRPVHVISWIRAYDNPAVRPGEGPFDTWRFELAYFGIGHRHVVVAQTSAAKHADVLAGFLCALDSNRTSLHLINRGTQTRTRQPILDPWFVASAALESRAHPFLLVDPGAGDHAAERVRFDGNLQADHDWPLETLEYQRPDDDPATMDLAFTFADYALLMPALHEHFRVVPADLESDALVVVADYLGMDEESTGRSVPFVWGIDEAGTLLRLAVSRALVFACRDRLNYWRSLQELAGVHNVYVEAAIERVLEDARASAEHERNELLRTHEQELDDARTAAAGDAMGQLVDVLMGADLSSIAEPVAPATMPAATPESPAVEDLVEPEAEAEPAVDDDDEVSFDEPWLDTAACTTCDDCMGINKMMFAYNDDKQAYLRDATAGTYSDLVRAAEICPAKCIHPGKPLDPSEPGLEELIARAAPFN
ncbi:MAG: ferredoxin [Gammaproteobacteria bacterium]|nr:ferredoxin [Gammaproteobacteria bacterium]NNF49293.1 ferredoxin [Woeseiaceae bacterium]MBT8094813.1 ferredoxin [Gammaproteobacteria bacterium]MBT8105011.1 ferredoxin [Gammaproteobacteria bacterium]NNK25025.1 ferredoxin [Woeseiaceae bacterium]